MANEQEIGTLVTKFVADLTDLQKGVEQYDKEMDKATQSTKGLDTTSINLAAQLSNVTTVYNLAEQAITFYTDATVAAYGEVKQFNRMTGTTVEQGGKWQDMMENMGLSLSDLTMSFRILSNNIQQAMGSEGSGAAKAFRTLGVSLTDANGKMKDSHNIMLETVSALQKLPTGYEKNALAMDTLGRSYMNLQKLLTDDVDVQKRYAEAVSATTTSGMANFDKYNAAMNKFNDTMDDLKVATGDEILPLFVYLLDAATKLIEKFSTILESIEYMGYLAGEIGKKGPGILLKGNEDQYFSRDEYKTQRRINEDAKTAEAAAKQKIKDDAKQTILDIQKQADLNAPFVAYKTDGTGTGSTGTGGEDTTGISNDMLLSHAGQGKSAESNLKAWLGTLKLKDEDYVKQLERYRLLKETKLTTDLQMLDSDINLLKSGTLGVTEAEETKTRIRQRAAEIEVQIGETTNKKLQSMWKETAASINSNPIKAVMDISLYLSTIKEPRAGGIPSPTIGGPSQQPGLHVVQGVGYWDGNAVGFAGSSAGTASNMYMWFFTAFKSGLSYEQARSAWASGDMGSWNLPGYGKIGADGEKTVGLWDAPMALGGPVSAGRPYLVGEAGPEIFSPDQNGTILPNGMMGGMCNIYVELDGEIIAQKIAAPLVNEIRLRTGARF